MRLLELVYFHGQPSFVFLTNVSGMARMSLVWSARFYSVFPLKSLDFAPRRLGGSLNGTICPVGSLPRAQEAVPGANIELRQTKNPAAELSQHSGRQVPHSGRRCRDHSAPHARPCERELLDLTPSQRDAHSGRHGDARDRRNVAGRRASVQGPLRLARDVASAFARKDRGAAEEDGGDRDPGVWSGYGGRF